ncbi:NmrA domain-containing protein [Mycena kentingensis (nom. inval.)]|nr:NmrA domain-containing protein [Mycena kentingensis (nom. inval.)]
MSLRIVSVIGATGQQGSAVARALLKEGTFTPRAIARNPDSDAAKKLVAEGIAVVQGDSLDKTSLVEAFRGSDAVFAFTVPIHPMSREGPNELVQGKNIVDAAKEAGIKFVVSTGMPSISKLSGGKYTRVLHYDFKEETEEYLRASGIPNATLYLGAFFENLWKHGNLKKTPTGYDVPIPRFQAHEKQAFTWVDRDIPQCTLALLKAYNAGRVAEVNGRSFPVVNANISYGELAARIEETLGVEVAFTRLESTGMPAMDEMLDAHAEYSGLYTATPVPNPGLVALGVRLGTLEEFLEQEVKMRYGPDGP